MSESHQAVGGYVYSQSTKYMTMTGLGMIVVLQQIIFLFIRGDLIQGQLITIITMAIFIFGMFILVDHYFLGLVKTDRYLFTEDTLIWQQDGQVKMTVLWKDISKAGGWLRVYLKRHHGESIDLNAPLFNPAPLRRMIKTRLAAAADVP